MSRMNRVLLVLGLVIAGILSACGGEDATPTPLPTLTPAPTPTPDPAMILRQAGETMEEVDSVFLTIRREGGPAYVDVNGTLNFVEAVGAYAAPAAFSADVKILGPGITLASSVVAIDEEQWLTNPLTGQWESVPPEWGFDPLLLFDEDEGWATVFDKGARDVVLVEELEGAEGRQFHLRATIDGEVAAPLSAGISRGEDIVADFWVQADTFHILRITFDTPTPTGEPAQWTLTFDRFGEPVTIEPPE